ncbi:MAG: Hpt domain-containing protein, partial [Aestuariivirgaceae bacterium]
IEMPVMDGVTAAQQIRALDGPTSRTPIIALSAFLADSRKAAIWRESFDINMAKPAGRDQLRQVIQAVIDVSHGIYVEADETARPAEGGDGLIDQDALARLRSEMTTDALQELFQLVIAEIQDCAKQLSDAKPENDHKAVARVAHKLKGIASTFAAPKLEHLSATLETDADHVCTDDLLERVSQTCACADETAAALSAARAA